MASLAQPPVSRERLTTLVTELFGDSPAAQPAAVRPGAPPQDWPQAVTRVAEQLCAKLGVPVAPERLRKALDLVLTHAVTLHADGTASVQSGTQTYTLNPECPCADAKNRAAFCKHTLAVELHRRARALLDGTAYAATAAPGASEAAAPATAAAVRPAAPAPPQAALWGTTEAPASCNIKLRVGNMELWYTARDVDDATLQQRLHGVLPWLEDVLLACEADYAARVATREAAQVPQGAQVSQAPPQAPPPPPAAPPQLDVQTLVQQAVQQVLAVQANGHAGAPAQEPAAADDQATGVCSLHQVPMQAHADAETGDTWHSHWLEAERRYCRGRRPSRRSRNGRH